MYLRATFCAFFTRLYLPHDMPGVEQRKRTGSAVDTTGILSSEAVSVAVSVVIETTVSVEGDGVSVSLLDAISLITLVIGSSSSGPDLFVVSVLGSLVLAGSGSATSGAADDTTVVTVSVVAELVEEEDATSVEVTVSVGVETEVDVDATSVDVTVTIGVENEVGSDGTTTTVVVDGAGGETVMYTTEVSGWTVTVVGSGAMVIEAIEALGSDLVTTGDCVVLAGVSTTDED